MHDENRMKQVLKCMLSVFKKKEEIKSAFTECLCKLDKLEKQLLTPKEAEKDGN